jgi:hypothetical protein
MWLMSRSFNYLHPRTKSKKKKLPAFRLIKNKIQDFRRESKMSGIRVLTKQNHNKRSWIRSMFHGIVVDTIDEWLRDAADDIVRNSGVSRYPYTHNFDRLKMYFFPVPSHRTAKNVISLCAIYYVHLQCTRVSQSYSTASWR